MIDNNFSFVQEFEKNWKLILNEFQLIQHSMVSWPEYHLYNNGWDVFGLFDFPNGNPIEENITQCPITAELIEKIPYHGAAGFSRLAANTVITPHKGYQGDFLRMHLGLEIPFGDCGLHSNGHVYRWEPGKAFVFDDRQTHDAWNNTSQERIVLIVDFIP